ncbi:NTP transferase domain-containing protein [Kribbella sp. NBC_01245]|uniref:nucleotidyltransferase family protein n=1 Tax=Kribbella sp. NBC_01245 TaxID=2903578 RepID=UPI002E2D8B57|nr:NTP transferase domain-containing protein [Kribbella sp. NBC_01245]
MILGLLLAAGAGRRMGGPKALVRDEAGVPWVVRAVEVLRSGGCPSVAVVVGAAADEVMPLLDGLDVAIVSSPEWETGMAASLRSGLAFAETTSASAVLVHLVDLLDTGDAVIRRVLAAVDDAPSALARAGYDGKAGHPVLIGRSHWAAAAEAAYGDRGAGPYLTAAGCPLIECGDLASGNDRDHR